MYFLLHHPTGALIFDAQSRQELEAWSERQLGARAKRTFILEWSESRPDSTVEKTGTGIYETANAVCQAKLSLMADSVQRVTAMAQEPHGLSMWHCAQAMTAAPAAVH